MLTHEPIRWLCNPVCGSVFSGEDALTRHWRRHCGRTLGTTLTTLMTIVTDGKEAHLVRLVWDGPGAAE